MTASLIHRDYEGALALNNMGITLLERKAYTEALETLKDAVCVMKQLLQSKSKTALQQAKPSNIDKKIQRAVRRLSSCSVFTKISIDSLDIFACFDTDIAKLLEVLCKGPSSTFYPIRIDVADFGIIEERDLDSDSAIVLYNFAVALTILGRIKFESEFATTDLERSLKLYDLAMSVFFRRCSACDDSVQQWQILLVAGLVLHNVAHVLSQLGRTKESRVAKRRLVSLSLSIQECYEPELYYGARQIKAAAAA